MRNSHNPSPTPCDITRAPPTDPSLDASLEKWQEEWDSTARYAVYIAPPFILNEPKTTIARWYTYAEAKALVTLWDERFMARNPSAGFGRMGLGLQLTMPRYHPVHTREARAGDLVLDMITQGTSHPMVTRQFWAVKHVDTVHDGRVLHLRDGAGRHAVCNPRSVRVPAAQLDMQLVERLLIEKAGVRTLYDGEYVSREYVLHVLRPALHRGEPSVATDADIERLLERYSDREIISQMSRVKLGN